MRKIIIIVLLFLLLLHHHHLCSRFGRTSVVFLPFFLFSCSVIACVFCCSATSPTPEMTFKQTSTPLRPLFNPNQVLNTCRFIRCQLGKMIKTSTRRLNTVRSKQASPCWWLAMVVRLGQGQGKHVFDRF